jgi:tight adherence protein B
VVNPNLLPLLTFLAVALAVIGCYSLVADLFLRDRSRVSRRLDEEFRQRQRDQARRSALFKDLGALAAEAAAEREATPSVRQRLETLIQQSGAGLPLLHVLRKRKRRLDRLTAQLPDAFELMSRIIRAGQTMPQGLLAVADEFDKPIAAEFAYCYEQQNLGLPTETALRDLARRTGVLEVKIFVLAMLVQQQTGGNLAELLDNLAATVRERFRMRGKIKALTAEGRMQAVVLLFLPPLLFLAILLINPSYAEVMWDHLGILVGTLAFEVVGALWIRKIVNFDY